MTYVLVALSVGSFLCSTVCGAESLQIESSDTPELLPYSFTVEQSNDWGVRKRPVGNQVQVLKPQRGLSDTAFYIRAFNSNLNRDDPAVFSLEMFTPKLVVDWDPLRLTLTNFGFYHDSASGARGIVGAGYRNDSAFAVVGIPGADHYDFIFLATGVDHTGDGRWEGSVAYLLTDDYDYDGHDEVFLWVGPGRDLKPRVLFCLEPDTRRIEWSLPVAGAISAPNFHSCRDSVNPAVILATYNLKNGVADENFDDNFCWLAKVNNRGDIVHQRIISEEHGGKGIWPGERDGLFYVFHALPMVLPGDSGSLSPQRYQLSRMESDFHLIGSVDVADRIVSAWWDDYGIDDAHCFHTLSSRGVVRIFDTTLQLLAESNQTNLHHFVDTIRLEGQDRPAYLFRSGGGIAIYDHQFEQLGNIDESFVNFHPLVLDDRGNVTHFVATRGNLDQVFVIKRRSFPDYARILFWQYRDYVLASLALLILALVMLNALRQRSVRRLAFSEERLHDFFENSQDAFYRSDREGRLIWGSPAVAMILGYDNVEDLVGNLIADIYADPQKRQYLLEQLQKTGKVTDYEVELRRRGGSTVIVSTNSAFYRDSRGHVAGVQGVFRDISERKRAEQELAKSEGRYRSLIESAQEAIFSVDRDGQFLFMNQVAVTRLGGKPSDFEGKTMWDLFPKQIADSQMATVREVFSSGEGVTNETATELQGRKHRYLTSIQPVMDESGRIDAVMAIAHDITELVETKRDLESERHFVHSLLDTANSLIVCLDNQARITVFNKGCEEVTGYSREEVIGQRWPETFLPDENRREVLDNFAEWVRQHPRDTYERPLRTKSGEMRTIMWSTSALFYPDSSEFTAIAVGQDITEKRIAEDALRESEQRLASLTESALDGILALDIHAHRVLYTNPAMYRLLGYSREELLKLGVENIYPCKYVKTALSEIEQIAAGRKKIVIEMPLLRKDGSIIYANVSAVRLVLDGREAVVGFFRDVTDRKRAQEALRESEEFNRAIIEKSPIGVSARDRTGRLVAYNEAWQTIWKMSDEDLGRDQTARERPEIQFDERDSYLGQWIPDVRRVYEEGGYLHIPEIEIKDPQKRQHLWLSQHFYAIKDPQGNVDRVVILTNDITDRKRAEEALRESEERFRTIAEATPIPLVITQVSTEEIVFVNTSFEQALGYPRDRMIGMKPEQLYDDPRERENILRLIRDTGSAVNQEIRGRRADGSMFWALVTLRRVMFNGEPAMFGVFNDITEHKEAERRLKEADRERYNQVRQIAGGVAHEICNALFPATSSLAKLSQRLEYSSPDDIERNQRLLMLAESAVGRAIGMTDLVTEYSRLDTERKTELVTLRPVLEEVAEANSERIKNLKVTVSMQVADDLVVSCRSDHLYSLFSNLLVNSLDALEEVSSRRIDVSAAGVNEYIRIQFADSGPGIALQHRSRIFDPFYSTKPTRGTGLGLAIVKRIVEMYGGRIELECPVDKGSLFVIFLKSVQPSSPQGDDYNGKNR